MQGNVDILTIWLSHLCQLTNKQYLSEIRAVTVTFTTMLLRLVLIKVHLMVTQLHCTESIIVTLHYAK